MANYSNIVAADKVMGYKEMYEQLKQMVANGNVGGSMTLGAETKIALQGTNIAPVQEGDPK